MKACPRCGEWSPERFRYCPSCGTSLGAAARAADRRRVVTVLFADVVGSTELGERVDDETLRWAMSRWFELMRQVVEQHGGHVEREVGDSVMAVFGIPVAHEDDALRAVRAAARLRARIAELSAELHAARGVEVTVRMGLNTGEAVTGAAGAGSTFTTGDAVNVAARLEQAAAPGEVLLGRDTLRLVGHAVRTEPVSPLVVKGKRAPVEAFRLVEVAARAAPRPPRARAPMVGRERERDAVLDAFARTTARRRGELVTLVGAPGVGKSRLVDEVLADLGDAATVARGRCLPYGDWPTWWPLVEALGHSGLFASVAGDDAHPAIQRAAELLDPTGVPVAPEEALWSVRLVLEALGRRHPLVLFLDDLQWAEPAFLDALEHCAEAIEDAPVLLLCTARPELLEQRAHWPAHMLEPLADQQAGALLEHLVGSAAIVPDVTDRVLAAAAGNPLFVIEFAAMLLEDGAIDAAAVPPTIQALLAARLDRLPPSERTAIEVASIAGHEFPAAVLGELTRGAVSRSELESLIRKDLIQPSGDQRYRFRHQLIRDVAYQGISKALRADLHERYAGALHAPALVVADELLGHHLERAVVLRRELGQSVAATAELAARASASLGAAGQRSVRRDDVATAVGLLRRAAALVDHDPAARGALLPALGACLFESGDMKDAIGVLEEAIASATEPRTAALARVELEHVRLEALPDESITAALGVAADALPALEDDVYGQCRAWCLTAQVRWLTGAIGHADAAWNQAGTFARRAGDERELLRIIGWRATAAALGPTPVDDAIARCETFLERVRASPVAVALVNNPLGSLHAMRGEFDVAEQYIAAANETLDQLGSLGWVSHHEALVRLLAGQPELAEVPLRAGLRRLASVSDRGMLATTAAMLGQALYDQGRLDEAAEQCDVAARVGAADDMVTQTIWRGVRAKVLAARGRPEEAERLAREAIALVESTDLLWHRADALIDLAEVLADGPAYQRTLEMALSLYERKGHAVGAARARALVGQR